MSLTPAALAAFWRNELGFYELVVAKKGKRNGYGEVGIKVRIWKLAVQAKHGVRQLAGWSGGLQDASKPKKVSRSALHNLSIIYMSAEEPERPNASNMDQLLQLFRSKHQRTCPRPRGRIPVKLNRPSAATVCSHSSTKGDVGSVPAHLLLRNIY